MNNKKILIVEDDKDFLFILQKKFEIEGFSVVTADSGEKGAAMAQQERPDLILSDILLPKMDGLEMAKEIEKSGVECPIIFLTNVNDVDYIEEAIKKGKYQRLIKSNLHVDKIVEKAKKKLGIK